MRQHQFPTAITADDSLKLINFVINGVGLVAIKWFDDVPPRQRETTAATRKSQDRQDSSTINRLLRQLRPRDRRQRWQNINRHPKRIALRSRRHMPRPSHDTRHPPTT